MAGFVVELLDMSDNQCALSTSSGLTKREGETKPHGLPPNFPLCFRGKGGVAVSWVYAMSFVTEARPPSS
jgi:hypothetical protein